MRKIYFSHVVVLLLACLPGCSKDNNDALAFSSGKGGSAGATDRVPTSTGGSSSSAKGGAGGGSSAQGGTGGSSLAKGGAGGGSSAQGGAGGSSSAKGGAGGSGSSAKGGIGGSFPSQQGGSWDASVSADVAGAGGKSSAGGTTGAVEVAAAGGASAGSFPRADDTPTVQTVSGTGQYQYESYSSGFVIANSTFLSATIFYPTTAAPPFAAIAFCPGYTEVETGFLSWGQMLASHGIVALVLTPENTLIDLPETRGDELLAALDTLVSENSRGDGPLNGKIATDRLGVMGHSMGGGGTLFACNKASNRLRAAVPLMPWQPLGTFPDCTAPTLVVAAENDALVNPDSMAHPEYQSLGATNKVYMEVAGDDHTSANDVSAGSNLYARYAIAWLKVYLEDDSRYEQFISGDAHQADVAAKLFVTFEP